MSKEAINKREVSVEIYIKNLDELEEMIVGALEHTRDLEKLIQEIQKFNPEVRVR